MTSATDCGERTRKAIDLIMARKDGAMTDNRTTELLNCPFCGGEAELHPTYDIDYGRIDGWFAWCNNDTCECQPETRQFFTEAEAIAAWNARAERTCNLNDHVADVAWCSECKHPMSYPKHPNYCPNCGAKAVDE